MTTYINEATFHRIAQRLKWLRNHHKLSQREFAASVGIQPTQYNNWETARQRLSLEGALRINQIYGTSLDFLFLNRADTLPAHLFNSWTSAERDKNSNTSSDPASS